MHDVQLAVPWWGEAGLPGISRPCRSELDPVWVFAEPIYQERWETLSELTGAACPRNPHGNKGSENIGRIHVKSRLSDYQERYDRGRSLFLKMGVQNV